MFAGKVFVSGQASVKQRSLDVAPENQQVTKQLH